uniref:Uncharacterized protein n=1 Tax=Aegilops tauschii subsp. strangulata TaxID=200361 RepID=A0A453NZ82_AEGTS
RCRTRPPIGNGAERKPAVSFRGHTLLFHFGRKICRTRTLTRRRHGQVPRRGAAFRRRGPRSATTAAS